MDATSHWNRISDYGIGQEQLSFILDIRARTSALNSYLSFFSDLTELSKAATEGLATGFLLSFTLHYRRKNPIIERKVK